MEGDEYVKLLFEDEAYTRSKAYFWILRCLQTFQHTIRDTCTHWKSFKEKYISPLEDLKEVNLLHFSISGERIDTNIAALGNIETEFSAMKEEVTLLHEGVCITDCSSLEIVLLNFPQLLNASSVGESRASTRLGENAKLLTYVSIFYLPLAFCAVRPHQFKLKCKYRQLIIPSRHSGRFLIYLNLRQRLLLLLRRSSSERSLTGLFSILTTWQTEAGGYMNLSEKEC
jgi:hypothetical protein